MFVKQDDFEGKGWIYHGLGLGIFLFLMIAVLMPLFSGEPRNGNLLTQFIICMVGGLVYGIVTKYVMRLFASKK